MFNICDLIVGLIIALATFLGYKRGFVKSSFRMLSFVIAIIISLLLRAPVSEYIKKNTNVSNWIINTITGTQTDETSNEKDIILIDGKNNEKDMENAENSVEVQETLERLPENLKEHIGIDETIDEAKEQIAIKVADAIINVMSMVSVYLITKLLLMIVCFILDGIMQIPVLKQINEIAGLVLGIILGVIQVYTILAVITFLSSFIQMPIIIELIKDSCIASRFFEYNLLIELIF